MATRGVLTSTASAGSAGLEAWASALWASVSHHASRKAGYKFVPTLYSPGRRWEAAQAKPDRPRPCMPIVMGGGSLPPLQHASWCHPSPACEATTRAQTPSSPDPGPHVLLRGQKCGHMDAAWTSLCPSCPGPTTRGPPDWLSEDIWLPFGPGHAPLDPAPWAGSRTPGPGAGCLSRAGQSRLPRLRINRVTTSCGHLEGELQTPSPQPPHPPQHVLGSREGHVTNQ